VMPVMVTASGSPSGSVTPTTDTFTNRWFGGQSTAGLVAAGLQSGGRFPGMVVVGGRVLVAEVVDVVVVGGRVVDIDAVVDVLLLDVALTVVLVGWVVVVDDVVVVVGG